jgi:hypothetical protein
MSLRIFKVHYSVTGSKYHPSRLLTARQNGITIEPVTLYSAPKSTEYIATGINLLSLLPQLSEFREARLLIPSDIIGI